MGILIPQKREYHKDHRIVKASDHINEPEDELIGRLQGETKEAFLAFCNAYDELMGEAELDAFAVGFRLGARMILDTFYGEE